MPYDHIPLGQFVFHPEKNPGFTTTEVMVIHYSLCDYSVKEIADLLHCSPNNIYQYHNRITEKTPVHSFISVVSWVLTEGIFSSEKEHHLMK